MIEKEKRPRGWVKVGGCVPTKGLFVGGVACETRLPSDRGDEIGIMQPEPTRIKNTTGPGEWSIEGGCCLHTKRSLLGGAA